MREKRSRIHPSFTATPARWWKNITIPMLPVLACFLGGATEKWSEGIVVVLLGVILMANPPRVSLGPVLNIVLLAIIACAATAFLPETWFPQPGWRFALASYFGISLPGTLSPQPWISLGCFVSFLAGLSWLYYVSALDLELREVRQQLRLFATGVALLAALCIALHSAHAALPFWHNERGFGPFPNRNQTANLFSLTAVVLLACGQDDLRHGRKRWIVWLLGLAIIIAAVVLDFSRAGVVILVLGSVFWIGVVAMRRRSPARLAVGFSFLLLLFSILLLMGGQTLERFHLRGLEGTGVSTDFRWLVFQDAFQLIRASPWCGIGLGNFNEIFAVFRNASLTGARTLHPESDWLWLWSEVGWPVIFLAIAALAILVRRVFPLQEGTNQRFRLAALVAAVLFALHGLVDVSGHRVGTAFAGIFFLGMALHRPAQLRASSVLPPLFRMMGLALLVSGTAWLVATRYEMSLPGAVGVENEMRKASAASQGRNFHETIQRTTRALEWAPLKWQIYFLRALGKVNAKQPPSDALDDFRRASFLEPNAYEVPYQEGIVWLAREPSFALAAWREALRRAGPERIDIYGHMLTITSQHSLIVRPGLEEIGMASHDLALVYLERAYGANFMTALRHFTEHDPDLQTFSSEERVKFFSLWAERGAQEELVRAVAARPDWMKEAWGSVAKYHARQNEFRSAFEIVRRFGEPPPMPQVSAGSSIEQLRRAFLAKPDNYAIGYEFYRAQIRENKVDDALMTLRHFTEQANCPRYFYFLEAEAWGTKENWERAWKTWEKFQTAKAQ